jgi:glycosyltransferase involved in cell wall biosynthesis
MRVGVFTDNDFSKVNGVTTTLRAVLRHLPADIAARVYTADDAGCDDADYLSLPAPGIGIPFYPEMRMHWPRFGAFLARARADRLDLIHYTTPGPVGLAARYVGWRMGIPMVGSFHTLLAEYATVLSGSRRLGQAMRVYQRWAYGCCGTVLAPSDATRRLLVEAGFAPDRLRVWARGVDTDAFTPDRRSPARRAAWGARHGVPVVAYVGRLSREKGLDDMPALSRWLRAQGQPHRLLFVGDGPMRAELEAACPEAIFAGKVPHDEVPSLLASADVFYFPSRTDTFGNVVLEAQACGVPVVVTDAGGPREVVVHGETGLVCGPSGRFTLALALELLLRDHARRIQMGIAARRAALARSWPRALAPLFETWRESCAGALAVREAVDADPPLSSTVRRNLAGERSL